MLIKSGGKTQTTFSFCNKRSSVLNFASDFEFFYKSNWQQYYKASLLTNCTVEECVSLIGFLRGLRKGCYVVKDFNRINRISRRYLAPKISCAKIVLFILMCTDINKCWWRESIPKKNQTKRRSCLILVFFF